MGPSFVIDKFEFLRGGVWHVRPFKGLVTFLVGHSKSGKSTAIEALLYPLGHQQVRLVFRIAGTRWQATRSGPDARARVELKNLDDCSGPGRSYPVSPGKARPVPDGPRPGPGRGHRYRARAFTSAAARSGPGR
ncbi:hypothetical protein [Streptomyces sp. NPDC042319]|uniref:hypothetical protein n=1 Tax=Streptomyces sp. NPDC042319 TaxID=3154332 RepID=UPI003407EAF8